MNDNFWNNIETKKKNFTSKELEVCELLEEDPFSFAASTATEISKRYGVSQAAVSRFCQKLGFTGYSDFRMNLMLATQTSKKHTIDSTPDYAKSLADIIIQLSQKLDDSLLEDLAKRVLNSRNSYTSGYGASDTAASLLAFRSMLGGIHFYHIHTSKETEMLHIMNNQDTIFLFSSNNPSHIDFITTIEELPKENRPYIILVTSTAKHPFAKKVDQVVLIPYLMQFDTINPLTAPQTIQIGFSLFLIQKIYNEKSKLESK